MLTRNGDEAIERSKSEAETLAGGPVFGGSRQVVAGTGYKGLAALLGRPAAGLVCGGRARPVQKGAGLGAAEPVFTAFRPGLGVDRLACLAKNMYICTYVLAPYLTE